MRVLAALVFFRVLQLRLEVVNLLLQMLVLVTDVFADIVSLVDDDRDNGGHDGDACDDAPGFVLIQFKTGERCLTADSEDDVHSTTACSSEDPRHQWELFEDGSHYGFRNLDRDACLSQTGPFWGPWKQRKSGRISTRIEAPGRPRIRVRNRVFFTRSSTPASSTPGILQERVLTRR